MILVDSRVGSREQLQLLRNLGVDAELAGNLDADFQFTGQGEDGELLIGVERKTIQDLLNSMRDGRLAGRQIGAMHSAYDVCVLLVEGLWRRGRGTGLVEMRNGNWHEARGRYHYAEVDRFLCSLRHLGGVLVWRTADEEESSAYIADEYLWWQKPWKEHRTARTIYAPAGERKRKPGTKAHLFRRDNEVSLLEKVLAQLPGVDSRAEDLAREFGSVQEMVEADVKRWTRIKGVGKKGAERIVGALRGA